MWLLWLSDVLQRRTSEDCDKIRVEDCSTLYYTQYTNTSLYSLRLYYYSLVPRNHLALPSEAESHFRAVCGALGTGTSLYSLCLYYYSLVFRNNLALPSEAESHFRAVCRALCTGTSLYSLCLYSYSLVPRNHLALPSEAESHFRAVCRALVSEALELSSFMEKVRP